MPPLKKGAYCFATVGRYVGRSVCRPSVVRSISFDPPLHLINTKLGAGVALNEKMIPIDFRVTCSKVKVKPLF